MQKFFSSQTLEIKQYYEHNGYVVIKKLLPNEPVETFLEAYEGIKQNKSFVFYSQSTHKSVKLSFTPEGFIKESMLDPLRLKLYPKFSTAIEQCLMHQNVSAVLSVLSGAQKHVMWQNMFFDFSPGTIEHQDHWYLDTTPPGHLIAAWYALEDIHPESGCFFVLPGSHKDDVLEPDAFSDHEAFRVATLELIKRKAYEYKSLPLQKGDVLLWHPYLIHGAHSNTNAQHSRKSFTAHFFPSEMETAVHRNQQKKATAVNANLLTAYEGSDIIWSIKKQLKYYRDNLTGNRAALMDMRRKSYSEDIANRG